MSIIKIMTKQTKQFIILLLLISIIPHNTSALKIQIDDNWIYEDSLKQKYNETVLENIQIISNDEIISVMKIKTDRGFSFPYQKTINLDVGIGGQIIFDLSSKNVGLFVTQEGGISLYPIGDMVGKVTAKIFDNTKSFNINNGNVTFSMLGGDPSLALISTASTIFSIQADIYHYDGDMQGITAPGIFYDVHYRQDIIISTNNDPSDLIKEYTLTPILVNYEFNWLDFNATVDELFNVRYTETLTDITQEIETLTSHWIETTPKTLNLSLNDIEPAQQYTYEVGTKFPIYIKQTEPVKIDGLSLSQEFHEVEYFLVRDEITSEIINSTTDKSSFIIFNLFLLSAGILVIINIINKRNY